MTPAADRLYALLPAYLRATDAERGGPLRALLDVLGAEVDVLDESLAQAYDDLFVETAADWAVPYLGDLIGYRPLPHAGPGRPGARAEVANTIRYRRRKGTAAVLEALARDVTGWPAAAVEFFEALATTTHVNHVRLDRPAFADLRAGRALDLAGTPFDRLPHTADVRHVAGGRGRYNVPNVGVFLWRIGAYPLTGSPAVPEDARRFRFHPLGVDAPLYGRGETEDEVTHLAEPVNVPLPLGHRTLAVDLDRYYGPSLAVEVDGVPLPAAAVRVCRLDDVRDASGAVTGWAHLPPAGAPVALDPALGRLAFPDGTAPADVRVGFHYGFGGDFGGGEYERAGSFADDLAPVVRVPDDAPTIQAALDALGADGGAVEITDSGRYAETLAIRPGPGRRVEVRAVNGRRPTLVLTAELDVKGGVGAEVALNGLLVTGAAVRVTGRLGVFRLAHCTLVPGGALGPDGAPREPYAPALRVAQTGPEPLAVVVDHSITGPIRLRPDGCTLTVRDSVVDSPTRAPAALAVGGFPVGDRPGPPLTVERSTFLGAVHVRELVLGSDAVFDGPVVADRRQRGCVRFSYVAAGSKTPRRHRCVPDETGTPGGGPSVRPHFVSTRYGDPGYALLRTSTPAAIRSGASDEGEMGAFHDGFAARREANLRARLDEYLRFGLEAGLFDVL